MTLLAGIEFHFDMDFHEIELHEAELYLEDLTSKYSNLIFNQQTKIYVKFEKGSLKIKLAILGAIYIGIGQYGSFRSGIDHLINDAKFLKELVTSAIIRNGVNESGV